MGGKKYSEAEHSRIQQYLDLFSMESEEIRAALVSMLPSYHLLLNFHALTFEEFALLGHAKEQGLPWQDSLFDFGQVKPPCVYCGEAVRIRKLQPNKYVCNSCGKKFSANHNSISSGTHCTSLVWMQVLQCMLHFYSMKETCAYCHISSTTFYTIRNRLFYGMKLFLEERKLYGEVQCDLTFTHISYKGMTLEDSDYPEDSPFEEGTFLPRGARKRGGTYSMKEKNQNSICIFAAVDEFGHSLTQVTGIGAASTSSLLRTVKKDHFLMEVPEVDPFPWKKEAESKKEDSTELSDPGTKTIFVTDGELALIKYAKKLGFPVESHVYRRNGIQVRLAKGARNIQRANNLHKRLRDFLSKTNYVSTKYLPGFLIFFDYLEAGGATEPAIAHLFELLTKPGLGMPETYFKELFSVPNYIAEWSKEDNPIHKFPYQQLEVCYLYDQHLRKVEGSLTVQEISDQTDYATTSVRRIYKNFESSGFLPQIRSFFEEQEKKRKAREGKQKSLPTTKPKKWLNPEVLSAYEEYYLAVQKPKEEQKPFRDFVSYLNQKYRVSYTERMWHYYFQCVAKSGIRPSYVEPLRGDPALFGFSMKQQKHSVLLAKQFQEYYKKASADSPGAVKRMDIYQQMADEHGISSDCVQRLVKKGQQIQRIWEEEETMEKRVGE